MFVGVVDEVPVSRLQSLKYQVRVAGILFYFINITDITDFFVVVKHDTDMYKIMNWN